MSYSCFKYLLGDSPRIKVLDFLLEYDIFDFSKKEVADKTKISRGTLNKFWNILVKEKIILKTRKIGNGTLYKLNRGSPIVKELMRLDFTISSKNKKIPVKKKTKSISKKYIHSHSVPGLAVSTRNI